MGRAKLSFEVVQALFGAVGWVLLEKSYKNIRTLMRYRCTCGEECMITVKSLKLGHGGCKPCAVKKRQFTCLERYGNAHPVKLNEFKAKSRETCLTNLGVEYSMQSEDVKAKSRQTCTERYGVPFALQNKEVRARGVKTYLERYGAKNSQQMEAIKLKTRKTCLDRYGVEYPMQSASIMAKSKATVMARYGVSHVSQHPDIFKRQQAGRFQFKDFMFPGGAIIRVQGYEGFCYYQLLESTCTETELLRGYFLRDDIAIYYDYQGKKRRYYPDIYLPSERKLIEVKSYYTYNRYREQNDIKMKSCAQQGYQSELWIYTNKGELTEILTYDADGSVTVETE